MDSKNTRGQKLAYLDNASTTQKPKVVLRAISDFYQNFCANTHRGVYQLAENATQIFETSREIVQKFINARYREEIIFTSGTTESINLLAQAWGEENINQNDEIILTEMEHHSNLVPWQILAQKKGARLLFIPITADGQLDMAVYEKMLSSKTKLVALTHLSNVLGTINDINFIVKKAKKFGATTFVDAAQSVAHLALDVQKINCDFLAFSAHKMYGPFGLGVLYGKREILEKMSPYQYGGEMIREVNKEKSSWNNLPYKFEAGTQNIAGAVGLAMAIGFLRRIGFAKISKHERSLSHYAMKKLSKNKNITIYGPSTRGAVIAFTHDFIHPHDLSAILDAKQNVATRSGHHCAMPLAKKIGVEATCRVSFGIYNTKEEIDRLMKGILSAEKIFNK